MNAISGHQDLIVYQRSFDAACQVYSASKRSPREVMHSLTDQSRRASRILAANIAETRRKHRYEKHFFSTLNITEGEAAETQTWIEFAAHHEYLSRAEANALNQKCDEILRMIVAMIRNPEKYCL